MTIITDPLFYALAVPAVLALGLSKGGFAGVGQAALPLLALAIPPFQAGAIMLPIMIAQDAFALWVYRKDWNGRILAIMIPGAAIGVIVAWALAAHISDTWRTRGLLTAAYEIWNEPNLDYEWGGRPDAGQYTRLLQAGYRGIKAGDPLAIVVSAGLAPTGGSAAEVALARRLYGADQVIPDLTFLRGMYRNGAQGYFDALGSHPYGGPDAPATPPGASTGPIYFRRAEEQRQVMLSFGDQSPIWATEFGWVLETDCYLGEHEWMEVAEAQQADYLAAAYEYADENWPWMGPMFLFNLDCGSVYWYAACDPVRWYSITYRENPYDPAHSPLLPRQAFGRLRELAKRSAW